MVAWFWLLLGFVYSGGYFHVATLDSRLLPGLVLASLPLIQAILIPAYVSRQTFVDAKQAIIRTAAAAVAFAGLAQNAYGLTKGFFSSPRAVWDYGLLAPGYVWTILILAGLAGGMALGTLRWRMQRTQQQASTPQPTLSRWHLYFHSAILWIATQALWFWLMEMQRRLFPPDGSQVLLSIAGSLLIAPLPIFFLPRKETSRWILALRYSALSAMVVVACFMLLVVAVVVAHIPNGIILWAGFPLPLVMAWILCLPWVFLYLWSTPLPRRPNVSQNLSAVAPLVFPADWVIVSLSMLALLATWPAGLFATSPVWLGWNGVGCAQSYSSQPYEYWFWKGYKGVSREVLNEDPIIFRPAVNPNFCITVPEQKLRDRESIDRGYRLAARTWIYLIDPDQWESESTRVKRDGVARLIGHDFSSYEELTAWWEQNSEFLTWSDENHWLEIRKTDWQIAHPNAWSLPPDESVVERLRDQGPAWFYWSDFQVNDPGLFGSAILDREARLRGLKLFVSDSIEVLTGDRQRRTREYLLRLTGKEYTTEDEWYDALHAIPFNDPRYNESWKATGMVADLCLRGQSGIHCPAAALKLLKELTGNPFDSPQQWVQWWHNNARRIELSLDGRTLLTRDD